MKYAILAILILLFGCKEWQVDQLKRHQYFKECMAALPAGPISTKYNDWDEVVEACDNIAYHQSQYWGENP